MNVLQFDSAQSWLAGVATFWRDRLRAKPPLRQCLASGNTPIPAYHEIVRSSRQGLVSFRDAEIFALDEFGDLPADDMGRCKNMLLRDIVGHVDLPKDRFHWFDPEVADWESECRAFDRKVGPGFDLVILGIGLNGHLGMNEPGSSAESPTRRTDLHPTTISSSAKYLTHQNLPKWGLTVGMKQFFAAQEVWLLATGPAKAEIVQKVVQGEMTEQVPASLMRRHPNCSIFLDPEAAARL
ncbi:MAG: glucosamine-6-phosphate deaminase [Verrucomicrobiota bacterium]